MSHVVDVLFTATDRVSDPDRCVDENDESRAFPVLTQCIIMRGPSRSLKKSNFKREVKIMADGHFGSSDHYSSYHLWKGWNKLFSYTPDEADYFAGETSDLKISDANVLEIGFGAGDFLQWATDEGAHVTGTEINPFLVKAAIERQIPVIDAHIENIADQFADHFDTIVAFDVFEHFTVGEIMKRLEAAEVMLKLGGKILLRFPNAQSPFGLASQYGDPTHQTSLSGCALEHLLQGSALELVRYEHSFRSKGRTWSVIFVRFLRYSLRNIISKCINFIYATKIHYDSNSVAVIIKIKN